MSAREALDEALARIDRCDDPALIISTVPAGYLKELADEIDAKAASDVPLRGMTFAVKDNIDVAGVPTTAACPAFATTPERSATVVDRLVEAGGLPTVKVNLDQFASGLVGTRSPYGTPRNPYDPLLVPGGSSSGSAVAVATGLTTFALGTDTAGSGRVPAAMCGVVGVKPTHGWLSCAGVLPAVRSIDCVSVFAPSVELGTRVTELASGFDPTDPFSRREPTDCAIGAPGSVQRLGVLTADVLSGLSVDESVLADYIACCNLLERRGFELAEVDPTDLFAIGDQLYGGPWITERLVLFGEFARSQPGQVNAAIRGVVASAAAYTPVDVHRARYVVEGLRHRVAALFDGLDALAFPTIACHVSIADIEHDPTGPNTRLGRFTTFTNLVGLSAITVPLNELAAAADRPPPSITVQAPAWSDRALAEAAGRIVGETVPVTEPAGWFHLAVAGAHLRGEPLEHQLVDRGARFVATTATAPAYRLYEIADSTPAKPALVHAGDMGASIEVDLWALSPAALGDFVHAIPPPLCIGTVELADGRQVTGFLSEPRALDRATDITTHGGWRAYRRTTTT